MAEIGLYEVPSLPPHEQQREAVQASAEGPGKKSRTRVCVPATRSGHRLALCVNIRWVPGSAGASEGPLRGQVF